MADTKISALAELAATPAGTDELAINDAGTSKKITVTNLTNFVTSGKTFAKVVKAADETVASSDTLQDDDELTFTPSINKVYSYIIMLWVDSNTTPDFKWALSLPTGAAAEWGTGGGIIFRSGTSTTVDDGTTPLSSAISGTGTRSFGNFGKLIMGTTAGSVTLQWAQDTSDTHPTKILQGSTILVWEE